MTHSTFKHSLHMDKIIQICIVVEFKKLLFKMLFCMATDWWVSNIKFQLKFICIYFEWNKTKSISNKFISCIWSNVWLSSHLISRFINFHNVTFCILIATIKTRAPQNLTFDHINFSLLILSVFIFSELKGKIILDFVWFNEKVTQKKYIPKSHLTLYLKF